MAQYDGTIRVNTKIDSGGFLSGLKKMSSQSKKLNNSISETTNEINRLQKEIQALQSSPLESSAISRMSAECDILEKKLLDLLNQREALEMDTASSLGGLGSIAVPNQAALDALMRNNGEWKKLTADIDKTEVALQKYENKLKQAQATEQKKTDSQIAKKFTLLEKACNKLDVYKTKLSEINGSESGIAKNLQRISDMSKKGFTNLTKHAGKSNGILDKLNHTVTRFTRRIWGVLSSALVFTVLTKAFTALREKMAAAVKQNAQFSASMAQISSNMNNVFNNLMAAAMPALNSIMSAIAKATSYLNAFVALLTGKTIKSSNAAADAANNQASAVGGVGEAAKKASEYLNGYDEMNVQASNSTSGGGGGGASGTDITYEDVDVSSQVADFLDRIKKAWEKADFTELGEIIGEKINASLEHIDWDKNNEDGYKIGKSFATFLNGIFETPGLFDNVGKTIAETLNTVTNTSLGFAENFHWEEFGKALADSIDAFFETYEADDVAESINKWIVGALTTASTLLKETDFEMIGKKIGEFLKTLNPTEWASVLAEVVWEAIKDGFDLLKGLFEEAPLETSLIAAFAILEFTGLGATLADQIGATVAKYLAVHGLELPGLKTIAVKGVGLALTIAAIELAADSMDKPDLESSVKATLLGAAGVLMLTGSAQLSLLAAVAIGCFKIGNAFYNYVGPVQKSADALAELIAGLFDGSYSLNEYIKAGNEMVMDWYVKIANIFMPDGKKIDPDNVPKNIIGNYVADLLFGSDEEKEEAKNFFISIIALVDNIKQKVKDKWDEAKNWIKDKALTTAVNIGTKAGTLWKNFKNSWGSRKLTASLGISTKIKSVWNGVKNGWNKVKTKLTFPIKTPHFIWGSRTTKILGQSIKVPDLKINWYANGGFPDMGQLFIAREAGAEMVGNIGGKPAVANNDQITTAIADAVGPAVYDAVMTALANSEMGSGDIAVYVGGQKITDFIIKDIQNRTKASGGINPLFV